MYWYFKNLHIPTIPRNNLDVILRNLNHFRRYFVFREIKKILFRDHPIGPLTWENAFQILQQLLSKGFCGSVGVVMVAY
jgi:hypothetical protein